jgi:Icc-related predicted phosphoesterase
MKLRIVAISDTHGLYRRIKIPAGDVLIHAGDMTRHGRLDEMDDFNEFLGTLPHPCKLIIAGNHDFSFESHPAESQRRLSNGTYLQDRGISVQGVNFYGSPWQPQFRDMAFNLARGPALQDKWRLIPQETDVLITHGPPRGQRDRSLLSGPVGCRDLMETVERIKPVLHIFGHIHEAAGQSSNGHTLFVNTSVCNALYWPVNQPFIYEFKAE